MAMSGTVLVNRSTKDNVYKYFQQRCITRTKRYRRGMSRRQTQTDSFQSSNSDFCIEETKEKDLRRKKKLKTNYLNENYMNKTDLKEKQFTDKILKRRNKRKMPERHQWTKEEKAALTRQFC
ncbi:hypothetical protein KUTeg_006416 [Tegillarca granosa]|uniref:Uncharacterized protein n=1 Tax=Tegillarca granosa TaxID=220873 RepID=A0ABQ9FGE6_TEGGR|nr:hypothetical protein KUTeg_006416 [Tegillarca granosa]